MVINKNTKLRSIGATMWFSDNPNMDWDKFHEDNLEAHYAEIMQREESSDDEDNGKTFRVTHRPRNRTASGSINENTSIIFGYDKDGGASRKKTKKENP